MLNPITYIPQETTLRMANIGNKDFDLLAKFKNISLRSMEEGND